MNIPAFTAQASLYRTSNRYRSSGFEAHGLRSSESVIAAYSPGQATLQRCRSCLNTCAFDRENCLAFADRAVSWWNPAVGILLYAGCETDFADCRDKCGTGLGPCCPKACGPRDPYNRADGCCDSDETCVEVDLIRIHAMAVVRAIDVSVLGNAVLQGKLVVAIRAARQATSVLTAISAVNSQVQFRLEMLRLRSALRQTHFNKLSVLRGYFSVGTSVVLQD